MNYLVIYIIYLISVSSMSAQSIVPSISWWFAQTPHQRGSFFVGEEDCYIFDVHGRQYSEYMTDESAAKATAYMVDHRGKLKNSDILDVFRTVFKNERHPKGDRGGEMYPEKHGIFDGDYWNSLSDDDMAIYFVKGYLACQKKYRGMVSAYTPDQLVVMINKLVLRAGNAADKLKIGTIIDKTLVRARK